MARQIRDAPKQKKDIEEVLQELTDLGLDSAFEQEREAVAVRAREMGAQAKIEIHGCPFVITGVVDGRAFYLRERWEAWRVTVAPADNPLADVWRDRDAGEIDIAEGFSSDFFTHDGKYSPVLALGVAVREVRDYLRRCACHHTRAAVYCPDCGTKMPEPDTAGAEANEVLAEALSSLIVHKDRQPEGYL